MSATPITQASNEALGDLLHDQGGAIQEAIVGVSEYLCNRLDGHFPEDAFHPAYKNTVSVLERAWRDYRELVAEAQRRLEPAERQHVGTAGSDRED